MEWYLWRQQQEVTSLSVSGRTDWAGGRWVRIVSVASVGIALAVSVFENEEKPQRHRIGCKTFDILPLLPTLFSEPQYQLYMDVSHVCSDFAPKVQLLAPFELLQ
jgi:hypothetical protein